MTARAMTSGELTNVRKDNQHSRLYFKTILPATVGTAQVTASTPSSDDRVISLNIDTWAWGSGYSAAKKDMLVYVGSTAGAYDKGMVRLREDLSGTPSTMKIGEISEIAWAENDHITIVEEVAFDARHVYIDSSEVTYMDYDQTYSDQHENPDPVPCLGPYIRRAYLSGATVDVDFDGGNSWVVGGTITGYVWTAPGASATSGLTTATPTITYNAVGTYRVACTVTASNGSTYEGIRYVYVYSDAAPPTTQFILEDLSGSFADGGWIATVRLYDDALTTELRDRGLCLLFADDWYGGTKVAQGPITNYENELFIGWIRGETIEWNPEQGSVVFEVAGPHYWLQNMLGFPSGLLDVTTTPTAWTEMQSMTLQKGIWHFLHWRTTCTRFMDVQVTSDSRQIAQFNAVPGLLWDQISTESYNTILAKPNCNRYGQLWVQIIDQVDVAANRSGYPTVMAVTTADMAVPVTLRRRVVNDIGLVDLNGVAYASGSGSALFSLSPGHIPSRYGGGTEAPQSLALSSQAQANTLAGWVWGWKNAVYPEISISLAQNNRFIDITPHQYLTLAVATANTERGINETITLVPRTVSFTYNTESGMLTCDVVGESVSVNKGAADGDPPTEPPTPEPPSLPPIEDPPIPPTTEEWPQKMYVSTLDGGVYYTETMTGTGGTMPTWESVNECDDGYDLSDNGVLSFVCDGVDPSAMQYALTNHTDDTARLVYKRAGTGQWTKIMDETLALSILGTGTDIHFHDIETDPENAGLLHILISYDSFNTSRVLHHSDYGGDGTSTGWTKNSGDESGPDNWHYNVDSISARGNNVIISHNRSASPRYNRPAFSADQGLTFFHADNLAGDSAAYVSYGSQSRVNPDTCYIGAWRSGGTYDIYKVTHTATTVKQDANNLGSGTFLNSMWHHPTNGDYMRLLKSNKLYVTSDDWVSINSPSTITGVESGGLNMIYCPQDDYIERIFLGVSTTSESNPHHIGIIEGETDTTFEGKSGDSAGSAPYTNSIPYTAGGVSLKGIWMIS